MNVITKQTVHIVCGYLTYIDITFCWQCRSPDEWVFGGGGGGGGWEPYPSTAFSESTLLGWYPGNSLLSHSPKYVRMSALSYVRTVRISSGALH